MTGIRFDQKVVETDDRAKTHMISATGRPLSDTGPKASYTTCVPLAAAVPIVSALFSVASTLSLLTSIDLARRRSKPNLAFVSGEVERVGWLRTAAMISRDRLLYPELFAASLACFRCLILDHFVRQKRRPSLPLGQPSLTL